MAWAIESQWDTFLLHHPECLLLCGYSLDGIRDSEFERRLGSAHAVVLRTDEAELRVDPGAIFRRVAFLELANAVNRVDKEGAQREVVQIKSQVLQMSKLSLLGQLSASMAHEINNPLAIVAGLVEQLRLSEGNNLNPDTEKKIARIERATERLIKIVANILRFARQEPLRKVVFSAQAAIRSALDLTQDKLNTRQITMILDLGKEEFFCQGDETILSQVFVNLFINASDAIVQTGRGDGLIELSVIANSDRQITVSVQDNGCGMEPEIKERIFSPFFTTKGPELGTGLGLSVAQAAIREHGGQITCESKVGHGTCFYVIIPRVDRT